MKSIKKAFIFIVMFAIAYFAWNIYTSKDRVDIDPCKIEVFRIDSQLSKIDTSNVLRVLNEINVLHGDAFIYYLKNHLSMNFTEFDSKFADKFVENTREFRSKQKSIDTLENLIIKGGTRFIKKVGNATIGYLTQAYFTKKIKHT